jgi:quinolinate synthase
MTTSITSLSWANLEEEGARCSICDHQNQNDLLRISLINPEEFLYCHPACMQSLARAPSNPLSPLLSRVVREIRREDILIQTPEELESQLQREHKILLPLAIFGCGLIIYDYIRRFH